MAGDLEPADRFQPSDGGVTGDSMVEEIGDCNDMTSEDKSLPVLVVDDNPGDQELVAVCRLSLDL